MLPIHERCSYSGSLTEDYEVRYENISHSDFLLIKVPENESVIDYQLEMLRYNPNSAVVPVEARQIGKDTYLYYEITSLISLEQFLKNNRICKKDYLEILRQVSGALLWCEGCLLQADRFVLDIAHIFLGTQKTASLLYLPVSRITGGADKLKKLITEMNNYLDDMVSNEPEIRYIIDFLRGEDFRIRGLNKVITELNINSYSNNIINFRGADTISAADSVPAPNNTDDSSLKPKNFTNILIAAFLQIPVFASILTAYAILKNSDAGNTMNYAAILLIAAAADILLIRFSLQKKHRFVLFDSKLSKKQPKGIASVNIKDKGMQKETADESNYNKEKPQQAYINESPETALLSFEKKRPKLSGTGEGAGETINITSDDFVIGRLKGQADYISNNSAIGRLHARIIYKDCGYYITDLNSKNGTYVNGIRLNGCVETEIKPGDRITLANEEYLFIV